VWWPISSRVGLAERLLVDGLNSMLLWAAKDNVPSCHLYVSLGGEPEHIAATYIAHLRDSTCSSYCCLPR